MGTADISDYEKHIARQNWRFPAFLLITVLLFILLLGIFIEQFIVPSQYEMEERNLMQMGKQLQLTLPYLTISEIQKTLREVKKNDENLSYIVLVDKTGKALAHSDPERVGMVFDDLISMKASMDGQIKRQIYTRDANNPQSKYHGEKVIDICIPFYDKKGVHTGAVELGLSLKEMSQDQMIFRIAFGIGSLIFMVTFSLIIFYRNAETKRGMKNLEASENKYKTLFHNSTNPLAFIEKDMTIVMVNNEFEKISGFYHWAGAGKNYRDFISRADDLNKITEFINSKDQSTASYDFRFVDSNGNFRDTFTTLRKMPGTERILLEAVDVTERNRMQTALRESEERYKLLINNASEGIAVAQGEYFQFVNDAACRMSGFSRDKLYTTQIINIVHPEDRQKVQQEYQRQLNSSKELSIYETRIVDAMNRTLWLRVSSVKIEWNGCPATLDFYTDITEQKKLDLEREKLLEELKCKNEKLELLEFSINNASDVFLWLNKDAELLYFNETAYKTLGYVSGAAESITLSDIDPNFSYDAWKIFVSEIKTKKAITAESAYKKKNGDRFPVEVTSTWIERDGKEFILSIVRDITERKNAQFALEESEKTYRITVEQTGLIIYDYNIGTGFIKWSGAIKEITGYSQEEFQKVDINAWDENIHPDERKRITDLMKNSMTNGVPFHEAYRFKIKDNNYIHIEDKGAVIYDLNKCPIRMVGTISNISDRLKAEAALKESEERYRLMVEQTKQLVFDYYIDTGCVNWAGAITDVTGFFKEEMQDKGYDYWKDNVHPDDLKKVQELVEGSIKSGELYEASYRFRNKNGNYIYIQARGALLKDSSGRPYRMMGTMMDATEKIKAQEALRESEELFRTLINAMPDIVCLKDGEGRWLIANDFDLKLFQLEGVEYQGKKDSELAVYSDFYSDAFKMCEETDGLTWRAGKATRGDEIISTPGGRPYIFDIIKVPTFYPDSSRKGLVVIGRDITQRREAEAEREKLLDELSLKNKELEDIVYVASHDLRSPLINIQGFSQRLENIAANMLKLFSSYELPAEFQSKVEVVLKEQIPNALHFIRTSGIKMDTLINGLLRLSRTGRTLLILEKLNINKMVSVIFSTVMYQIQKLGVVIEAGDLPDCIGDASQISQIFSNLIDNALKYRHPQRKLIIKISGTVQDSTAVYCVEDNGLGISKEYHDKIWQLFNRLNPQGPIPGEGLGLTLVKRIVERHGGRVWLESEVGQGSKFYFELPVDKKQII